MFAENTPRWLMEPAVHPEAVGHVQRAQQSGLPGGAGSPLHRQASVSERNNNRRVSCPRGNAVGDARKVPGRSCDEYPFASTREGAASNPNGRPFNPECHVPDLGAATGPTGYSVCMIDNPQNLLAGGLLGVFYGRMRVIDNDAFVVLATGGTLPPAP
ncbi:NucA/NucB deoxyribonuclease domain-containing protein [Nocardia farcinica]|uniref:NucA/NucB deoxyribonuclease domain-containing protein n=1 Tax=Nocardia farcinica TaxID=37329 RepID=UPI0012FEFC35|nr:NucA/NucB deoxyribonuclease domain-containing protein [Nocardia farcinica]